MNNKEIIEKVLKEEPFIWTQRLTSIPIIKKKIGILMEKALAMKEEKLSLYEYLKERIVFVPEDYDTKEAISAFKAGYAAGYKDGINDLKKSLAEKDVEISLLGKQINILQIKNHKPK